MRRFDGRTVLVTGASSGIGLAAAEAFAGEGAFVVITGRNEDSLKRAEHSSGPRTLAIRNDAAEPSSAEHLADALRAQGLRLDAAFLNAGIAQFSGLHDVTPEFWDRIFAVNAKAIFFQVQALSPLFRPGASIVINGSVNARLGMRDSSVYAASKAAAISLAKTLSAELLSRGIRINVVSPGPVQTPLYGKLGLDKATLEATAAKVKAQVPLRRFGQAAEIASTVMHLASTESAFMVGCEVVVDGGMTSL